MVKKKAVKKKAAKKAVKKEAQKAKPAGLGKKFTCHNCGVKFYDLNKPEKLCPKCGTDQMLKPKTRIVKTKEYDIDDEDMDKADLKIDDDYAIEEEDEDL